MTYYSYPNDEVHNLSFTPGEGSDGVKMSNAAGKVARQKYCIRELKKLIKPGSTVYTILRNVSRDGMSRQIDTVIVRKGKIQNITQLVGDATYTRIGKHGSLVVGGYGMDMGFAVTYDLGCFMWPKGTRKAHGRRNGSPDHGGGYTFRQAWL